MTSIPSGRPRAAVPRRTPRAVLVAVLFFAPVACSGVSAAPQRLTPSALTDDSAVVRDVAGTEASVTVMAAGDIAGSKADAGSTGDLIRAAQPKAVLALGDNAYPSGTLTDYTSRYAPTWGSFEPSTHPVPGNHEYTGGSPTGYTSYFGRAQVTNRTDGGLYYAWDVGNGWRAYAVNTEIDTRGAQLTWLRQDLAAHKGMRYLLYTHHPRYTSGTSHAPSIKVCPLWNALAATGRLEIVLAGHNHNYERFAPMDCAGHAIANGARSFVVGSGGNRLNGFGTPQPGSTFRNAADYGVLRLALTSTSYTWSFVASGRGWNGSASVQTGHTGQVLDKGSEQLAAAGAGTLDIAVAAGSDDAEQLIGGSTTVSSDDLDLGIDSTAKQVVGIRFAEVSIPQGATIKTAYVRFRADEARNVGTALTIGAESTGNAPTYWSGAGTISARPVTGAVRWTPQGWQTSGAAYRTPQLAPLVQTVVNRSDWASGNALAFQFRGDGRRVAESYEGSPTGAPVLHVEFTTGS